MKLGKRVVFKDAKVPVAYTDPVKYIDFKKGDVIFIPYGRRREGDYTVHGKGIFKSKQLRGFSKPEVVQKIREIREELKNLQAK